MENRIRDLLADIEDEKLKEQYCRLILTLLEKGYFPGLAGVPVSKSAVSSIDGEKGVLMYRGYPADELAENCSLEEVCYLILRGDLPLEEEEETLRSELLANVYLPDELARLVATYNRNVHPMNMLSGAVVLMEAFDKESSNVEHYRENYARSVRLVAKFPTIMGTFLTQDPDFNKGRTFSSFAEYCLFCYNQELASDPEYVSIFEQSLILHADHTMNNSTFSARAVGSSKACIYSLIASAVNSLSGPLHGGANEAVIKMLRQIGSPDKVEQFVDDTLARHEKIMGVGHRVYKTLDPRARYFKEKSIPKLFDERADQIQKENPELWNLYQTAVRLEEVVLDRLSGKKLYPNVDFWSGLVYMAMGIKPEFFTTIFAVGRVIGWCAHWIEQMEVENKIFRPQQLYDGFGPRHLPFRKRKEVQLKPEEAGTEEPEEEAVS